MMMANGAICGQMMPAGLARRTRAGASRSQGDARGARCTTGETMRSECKGFRRAVKMGMQQPKPRHLSSSPSRTVPKRNELRGSRLQAASKSYTFLTGFPFPLGPMFKRDTVIREIDRDSIWVLEQTQALEPVGVYTPVRMTVIKLSSGGLWIHGPLAPTEECIAMIRSLGAPVEYIVLPTFAYEHKAFLAPFSRRFPEAQVFVTPYQWSFPVNLPNRLLGIKADILTPTESGMPWEGEIEQRLMLPPSISIGDYARQGECSFFHKRSRTLLVTDSLAFLDDDVPEVIPREALLGIARDTWLSRGRPGDLTPEEVAAVADDTPQSDTVEARVRGYRRMCLICLYFDPSNLLQPEASWEAVAGRLICPPVVETLIYGNVKGTVRRWVDSMVDAWPIARVIPAHYAAPIKATPEDVRRAFAFAYSTEEEDEERSLSSKEEPRKLVSSSGDQPWAFFQRFGKEKRGIITQQQPAPPVVFPESDVGTLRWLNGKLQALGVVRKACD